MKTMHLVFFLMLATLLASNPTYVPITTIAEDFGATWCTSCPTAWQGLQVLHSQTTNNEFITARLYTDSGALSSPEIQARFDYYQAIGLPTVLFNGKIRIEGSGDSIADGSLYNAALNQFRYSSSPISIDIDSFSASNGTISGNVQMVSPTENITNAQMVYYLLEDNVSTDDTHVVRRVLSDDINLSGAGNNFPFNKTFTVSPSWNTGNLWALVFVQLANKTILQSATSLAPPTYSFRCAMNWNGMALTSDANLNFTSLPLWFFNQGLADDYTMRIDVDSAPEGWYFNYCDEEGNCYPGSSDIPFSMTAGENKSFHLNLSIGDAGVANFRMVVSSSHIGTYSIPFHFFTTGMAADDETLSPAPVTLGGVWPNPVRASGSLTLTADKNLGAMALDIFNLKGQKVQSLTIDHIVQGDNAINFTPAPGLANGVYFYRLSGSSTPAKRFVLVR